MAKMRLNRPGSTPRMKDLKLLSLLEVTKAINNNLSTEELLVLFTQILKDQLFIGKLALFMNENGWHCVSSYGVGDAYLNFNVEEKLIEFKEISTVDLRNHFAFDEHNGLEVVIPVYHKSIPLAYILIGDIEEKMELSPTIKHLPFIQTLANIIFVAIENKKLAKESLRQAAVNKELELASEMQSMLFPQTLPNNEKLETAAVYLPHQQVGGDYYDFIWLNEHEFVFCMADVSGKGMAAALLMSNFQANLRALFYHTSSLSELVVELNQKVMLSANGEKFITLFIGKYNLLTRTLSYINAGHNPALVISGSTIYQLKTGTTGLGMFDELPNVKEGIITLAPNSIVFCYTDGVVELENENHDFFGIEHLYDLFLTKSDMSMDTINNLIIGKLMSFKGRNEFVDDIALLTFRIK